MTPAEASQILTLAAAVDNRHFDDMTCVAWADALDGLALDDCLNGVRIFNRRNTTGYLLPGVLREIVRGLIRDRQEAARVEAYQLSIAAADPKTVAERVDAIRAAITEGNRLPADKSPHPDQPLPAVSRQASKVKCPWCEALIGEPCVNKATGLRSGVTHDARLIAAGLRPDSAALKAKGLANA